MMKMIELGVGWKVFGILLILTLVLGALTFYDKLGGEGIIGFAMGVLAIIERVLARNGNGSAEGGKT